MNPFDALDIRFHVIDQSATEVEKHGFDYGCVPFRSLSLVVANVMILLYGFNSDKDHFSSGRSTIDFQHLTKKCYYFCG